MENFLIAVPSRDRFDWFGLPVLRELEDKFQSVPRTLLFCHNGQFSKYRDLRDTYHPWVGLEEVPEHVDGIGPTRDWILQRAFNLKFSVVLMLDDDIKFSVRTQHDPVKLSRKAPCDGLFEWVLEKVSQGYIHGGVSARQGNNFKKGVLEEEWVRCNNVHWFNVQKFVEQDIKFSELPVMEDFYVTLSLLSRGFPNITTYQWCWDQEGSGLKGGCSAYRTKEVQKLAAEKLASLFPDFVTVELKFNSTDKHGNVFSGVRHDVRIQWKKLAKTHHSQSKSN